MKIDALEAATMAYAARSLLICPFCKEVVTETTLYTPPATVEEIVRTHVEERHPIRWRLSMKWRRAMRVSRAVALRST